MARLKEQKRQQILDQTRAKLLAAAAEEFARAGFPGANINTISTSAGFAKGTIYNYFPSKQALLLALIDATALEHAIYLRERVLVDGDPARRLERFYQAGFDFVSTNLPQTRSIFNVINGPDEQLKAYVFTAYQPLFQFVAEEVLAPGMAQGLFRPVDPTQMALLLMTIYLGTASQHDEQGRPWLDPAQVANLMLHGLSL